MNQSRRNFSSSLLGQRLIEAGYLTDKQLREAMAAQAETGLLLGEVCMLKGWLSYAQLKECLPNLRSKTGEKLLALGYITMEQLWLALFEQRQTGVKLGTILVERGWIDQAILENVIGSNARARSN